MVCYAMHLTPKIHNNYLSNYMPFSHSHKTSFQQSFYTSICEMRAVNGYLPKEDKPRVFSLHTSHDISLQIASPQEQSIKVESNCSQEFVKKSYKNINIWIIISRVLWLRLLLGKQLLIIVSHYPRVFKLFTWLVTCGSCLELFLCCHQLNQHLIINTRENGTQL